MPSSFIRSASSVLKIILVNEEILYTNDPNKNKLIDELTKLLQEERDKTSVLIQYLENNYQALPDALFSEKQNFYTFGGNAQSISLIQILFKYIDQAIITSKMDKKQLTRENDQFTLLLKNIESILSLLNTYNVFADSNVVITEELRSAF